MSRWRIAWSALADVAPWLAVTAYAVSLILLVDFLGSNRCERAAQAIVPPAPDVASALPIPPLPSTRSRPLYVDGGRCGTIYDAADGVRLVTDDAHRCFRAK